MGKDYYRILGIDKNTSQDDVKKAFRKLAHEYHPDKTHGDEAKFKEINEAYQVLGDKDKRARYDQFGSGFENGQARGGGAGGYGGYEGFNGQGFNINMDDLGDMFSGFGDIFGFGGGGGRGGKKSNRGRDIEVLINIDFAEAVFGVEKELKLKKSVKCDHCHGNCAEPGSKIETCKTCGGTGQVSRVQRTIFGAMQTQMTCEECNGEGKVYAQKCKKCSGNGVCQDVATLKVMIPAGIDDGQVINLSGHGEAGPKGGQAGDLYLKIRVNQDKRFERDGFDIKTKTNINFMQAALGDKIDIETVDGIVTLKIPEGTQSGTVFRLKEKGVTRLHSRGRGDHFVDVHVKTPTNLSKKDKELLKELGK